MKSDTIIRLGDKFLYIDIVKTDAGNIRIGTMPELSKYLLKKRIKIGYVILPAPEASQAGDNYTGEEFLCWNKIRNRDMSSITYMGEKKNVQYLYKKLLQTVNWAFNRSKTKLVKTRRLQKIFRKKYLKNGSDHHFGKDVRLRLEEDNIIISQKGHVIYDRSKERKKQDIDGEVKALLANIRSKREYINHLEIIPLGVGNGFRGHTSNFLIKYADRRIWVDVMARPFLALKKIKCHWDNITDYFISHIHEDHVEGFTAVLERASLYSKRINIITTKKIFKMLKKRYSYLFPDFHLLVHHVNIIPHYTLPYYHGYLTVRLNHHVLKSGTLGLKVQFKNNVFALSGDTKYDSHLARRLRGKPSFDPSWYNDCHLVFHEVEFEDPNNAHTYYKEVKKIASRIHGQVLVYHSSSARYLMEGAKEYKRYIIKKGKVKVKDL
ncbi:MAG: hypothetical protein JW827_09735 [Spirochaetes bacterium]|nr:hypothetical protein [Spirochaetota bacterium]